MIITFLDGSKKEFEKGVSSLDIANSISSSLAKKSVFALVNGEAYDLTRPILEDSTLELKMKEDAIDVLNHSCAHLLAAAIKRLYPKAMFGVGPAIEEGFYYDVNPGQDVKFTDADLPKIEKEMKHIVSQNIKFERKEVNKQEALELFKDDKYKVEIINELDDNAVITTYTNGEYSDLCRGPHVLSTILLKNFKLLSVAGAYWRGDSNNEQLQRIYGTCFFNEEDLKKHLVDLEERKKRDHRKLGKELDLFMMSDYGPGFPFWLPKGMALKNALTAFWQDVHVKAGYDFIQTPIMLNRELWETSGHWFNYKENMYTSTIDEQDFAIKPMNCPGGMLVYKNSIHSYRDFPLRLGELGLVHRHEASGALADACTKAGFDYKLNPGDGAFYGPKLDFKLRDSMNRIWQCGTIQLDMNLPERFELTYVAEDGTKKRPVMIHRALFGSLERFIGILIEHYAGAFPTWLAPVQVKLIPVNNEYHLDFVNKVKELLLKENIRLEVDERDEKLGYKIREAQTKKIPYQLVVGDNEVQNNLLTVRKYGSKDTETLSVEDFIKNLTEEIKTLGMNK